MVMQLVFDIGSDLPLRFHSRTIKVLDSFNNSLGGLYKCLGRPNQKQSWQGSRCCFFVFVFFSLNDYIPRFKYPTKHHPQAVIWYWSLKSPRGNLAERLNCTLRCKCYGLWEKKKRRTGKTTYHISLMCTTVQSMRLQGSSPTTCFMAIIYVAPLTSFLDSKDQEAETPSGYAKKWTGMIQVY